MSHITGEKLVKTIRKIIDDDKFATITQLEKIEIVLDNFEDWNEKPNKSVFDGIGKR